MNTLLCTCGKNLAYSRSGLEPMDIEPKCSGCYADAMASLRELVEIIETDERHRERVEEIKEEYL